jgi:hypothetical protein
VGPDVDFAGAGSPILAALNEDSITDSMMVYHVPRTKSLRFKWRDKAFDGVTAVRATEEGFVVTTSDGAKLVRPVDGAKAEVVDHTVTTKAESHQAAADTASDRTGTTPTNSIGKAISAYLGR